MSIDNDMWDGFFDETEPAEEEPATEETEVEETEIDTAEETVVDEEGEPSGGDPTEETAEEPAEKQGGFTAEMQAAIDAEAQKRVDAAIARQFAGMTNPFTGQPIRTERDLIAYKEAYDAACEAYLEARKAYEDSLADGDFDAKKKTAFVMPTQ